MTLILTRRDVAAVLADSGGSVLDHLIDGIEQSHVQLGEGVVKQHPRIYLRQPREGVRRPPGLLSMSALLPASGLMGTRLMSVTRSGKGGHGVLVLFDHLEARLLAIVDDHLVHSYRSGAPAGLATRYLARPESEVIGCFGSSVIAMGGLVMTARALPNLKAVRVYSPTRRNRERFAAEMGDYLGVEVLAVEEAAEAAEADVLVAATNADRPVVPDSAIRPGTHINLLARNEVEMATFERAHLISNSLDAHEQLDPPWSDPIPPKWFDGELSDIALGTVGRRGSGEEVTVFVGNGPLAMWDVITASVFAEHARTLGLGTEMEIAGS